MKKILTNLFIIVICFVTVFTLAGCKPAWSEFSNTPAANSGIAVKHDGYLYFINGTKTASETANKGNIVQGAIYRVKLDQEGQIEYEEDGETMKEVTKVVNALVGFDEGSIHIFGDYLYYATTSNRVNSSSEVLFGQIEFARYDIKSGNSQTFYTTKKSDDTINYAYYVNGNSIDFVIFEKNNATLTSLNISNKITTNFVKEDITGAILSENFGKSLKTINENEPVDDADCYVFYTMAADPDGEFKDGNRVYFASSNGDFDELLNEKNESVTLFAIECGKLIYTVNDYVYADSINCESSTLSYSTDDLSTIISYETYSDEGEQVMFVERNGNLVLLIYSGAEIKFIDWGNYPVFNDDTVYDFGDSSTKIEFIGVDGDYLIFTRNKKLNKIKIFNTTRSEAPIALSSSEFVAGKELMVTEIVDGYAYGYVTKDSKTYMYRVSLADPTGSTVEEAEFLGIKE